VPGLGQTDSGTGLKTLDDVVLCPSSPSSFCRFHSPWLAKVSSKGGASPLHGRFRRKPESSISKGLGNTWTPVFTGVTTFYEFIKVDNLVKSRKTLFFVIPANAGIQ
jgi:hypothetical protein